MKRPISPDNRRERASTQGSSSRSPKALSILVQAASSSNRILHIPTPKTMGAHEIQRRRQPPSLPASGKPAPAEPSRPKGEAPCGSSSSVPAPARLGDSLKEGTVVPCPKPPFSHPLALLRPPAPMKRRPNRARCANAADSSVACDLFMSVLAFLGDESKLYCSLAASIHQSVHVRRILQACAAETAIRYLSSFQRFASTCESLNYSLIQLEEIEMADILVTLSLERHEDISAGSCSITTIKALRWVCRNTDTDCLAKAYGPLLTSFLSRKLPRDRKEAVPLPLYALVHFERRILSSSATIGEVLLLGAILATTWSSLRFADSQRIEWSSFSFDVATFRGICYQTKTSWQGQPFGLVASGFLSRGSHSWVAKWLRVLDSLASQNYRDYAEQASFLWVDLDADSSPIMPLQAMSYASALKWLHHFLSFPWPSDPPSLPIMNFTLHSLKGTMLSYALELPEISDGDRGSQGHHRGSSVVLYSRDDVLGALRLQQQIRLAVLGNWRPRTPQHRGGQSPMTPVPVVLEAFSKQISLAPWGYFSFELGSPGALPHCVAPHLPDSGSANASHATTSAQASQAVKQPRIQHSRIPPSQKSTTWSLLTKSAS